MNAKEFITAEHIKLVLANTPQITFEVTEKCNLTCEYCGYGELYCDHDLCENMDLEVESAIKLLDYLVALWNSPLSQSVNNKVYISFYEGEPSYRINKSGKNSFDDIIKNVNRLKDLFPDYFADNVSFNAVLHNRNSVSKTYNFIHSNYGKAPNITSLNDMGIRESGTLCEHAAKLSNLSYIQCIVICLFYFGCMSIFGQKMEFSCRSITDYDVLDTSSMRVAYSLEYIYDIDHPADKSSDVVYLDIGKKMSKCYSYAAYCVDSIVTTEILQGSTDDTYKPATEALEIEVYKNYLLRQTKVVHRTPIPNTDDFLYTDDYCNFNWEIQSDKKTILGYSCQKVTTTFRGRTWEAWFTAEIPVSDGPWKFCGLSGLILEVSDSQKHYLFTCTGIETKQHPIVMYKWNYEKTTREKLNALLVSFYANFVSQLENMGVMVLSGKSGKPVAAPKDFSLPYNPIELE